LKSKENFGFRTSITGGVLLPGPLRGPHKVGIARPLLARFPSASYGGQAVWGHALKRPTQRHTLFPNKRKVLASRISADDIEAAAVGAKYAPSPYHCPENGRLRYRVKPATPCPRIFSLPQAGRALREAIRSRHISEDWVNGFPRRVWHREGDQWYEACTNTGTAGTYHAYPIEPAGLPAGLQR